MIKDNQMRRLIKIMNKTDNISLSASKTDMDEKTARKYLKLNKLPSDLKKEHSWITRKDPFEENWNEVCELLTRNNGLNAKTLFEYLQKKYPEKYQDGQKRTLERKIKHWKALNGTSKEVYFEQVHKPGELAQSDFTHMNDLGITINCEIFIHMIYHFVLTYSNWETGTICYSESFESISLGFQNALWNLGGVPKYHQTDSLTACVQRPNNPDEFTARYTALMNYYKIGGKKTQPASPNENGDIEQRHYRFKKTVEQQLMLRGSKDFSSIEEYQAFLNSLFTQLNAGRINKFSEEQNVLRRLPDGRLESLHKISAKVTKGSTVRLHNNIYSVDSRLIGENVVLHLYYEHIEVFYGQKRVESFPRLKGEKKHNIQYRHIIDWLIRKPHAFANYKFKDDLFPASNFRIYYDYLKKKHNEHKADKEYLRILHLAAMRGETDVENALDCLFKLQNDFSYEDVEYAINNWQKELWELKTDVRVQEVNLESYDDLLNKEEVLV
jgi:hypothetical protein